MEDEQILELLWNRIDSAIDALAVKFGKLLYRIALNILNSHPDAEESVNDTYLAIWNAIPPQRPDPLTGFVCRVGRNTALKRLRLNTAQKRNSAYDLSLDELSNCIPDSASEETLNARELGYAIDRFLEEQTATNRIIFLRRYWFGDNVGTIAKLMGIRENAVSARLNRTRTALKAYLIKEGFFDEA